MEIEDFFNKYPNEFHSEDTLLNPYNEDFYTSIYKKYEFYEKKLPPQEEKSKKIGEPLNHQRIISRFLSANTPYGGLLLVHEMGTGKTGVSVAVAELLKNQVEYRKNQTFRRALVLLRSRSLIDNYKHELAFVNTRGQYIPENYDSLTETQKYSRLNKKLIEFYDFSTFEVFAKLVASMSRDEILINYGNRVIIIDEVHNIRFKDPSGLNIYNVIHKFLHIVENCKILLMTATPMKDKPEELANLLNLILPLEQQLPTEKKFVSQFLDKSDTGIYTPKPDQIDTLKKFLKGRVSYLKTQISDVRKEYMGKPIGKLTKLKIWENMMSSFQYKYYKQAYEKDKLSRPVKGDMVLELEGFEDELQEVKTGDGTGIYSNSRQASLFVFPNGTWGNKGFKKYIRVSKGELGKFAEEKIVSSYSLGAELSNYFKSQTQDEILEKISKCSTKYATVIKKILEEPDRLHFVYGSFVEGSGVILFSKLLELFGFKPSKGNDKTPSLRYAIITNKTTTTSQTRNILSLFNDPSNMTGKYISVIIGSRVIGEGFSLKNISNIHILTPFWNYSETSQAIARGIRLFSHRDLQDAGLNPIVKIYHHVSMYNTDEDFIDYIMYLLSETKDISIKSLERIIKESAVDCALNYDRNYIKNEDNTRLCEYTKCDYDCDVIGKPQKLKDYEIDYSTYNLYYWDDDLDDVMEMIKKIFRYHDKILLNQITRYIVKYNRTIIIKTLDYIMSNNITLQNKNHNLCYLKNYRDLYYLDYSIKNQSSITHIYYLSHPVFYELNKVNNITYKSQIMKIPYIIQRLENTQNYQEIFKNLDIQLVELFIEASVLNKKKNINTNRDIRNWVLETYKKYIIEYEDTIMSYLLYESQDILRVLIDDKWQDGDKLMRENFERYQQEKQEKITYDYYGIYDEKENKFKIRDVSSPSKKAGPKKNILTTGQTCITMKRDRLVKICMALKIPYDKNKFLNMTRNDIMKLRKSQNYKNVIRYFTQEELDKIPLEELKRLFYWSSDEKNIRELCEELKLWFQNHEALIYT